MLTTTLILWSWSGVFMLLFGINFTCIISCCFALFSEAFARGLHVYLGIVAFSTLTITANIAGSLHGSVGHAAHGVLSSVIPSSGDHRLRHGGLQPPGRPYSRVVI